VAVTAFGPCAKRTYTDKTAAKLALRHVQSLRREQAAAGTLVPGKGEQSVYRCPNPACRGWHLTSKAKDPMTDVAKVAMRTAPRAVRRALA
jgi:hypothetical protein